MVVLADEDVLRLDVPMGESGPVSRIERVRDLGEDRDRAGRLQIAVGDQLLEVGAANEPHREEQRLCDLARLVDRNDVRVVDPGLKNALAAKSLAEVHILEEVRRQELERDRAIERKLRGLVHDAHPTLAQDVLDPVPGHDIPWRQHLTDAARGQAISHPRLLRGLSVRC